MSLDALFKQVLSDPNDQDDPIKIGVLGAGCSIATEATAEISHFYNLAQVSYTLLGGLCMSEIRN